MLGRHQGSFDVCPLALQSSTQLWQALVVFLPAAVLGVNLHTESKFCDAVPQEASRRISERNLEYRCLPFPAESTRRLTLLDAQRCLTCICRVDRRSSCHLHPRPDSIAIMRHKAM